MCLVCVNVPRWKLGMRDVFSVVAALVLALFLVVPEAEAARKKRPASGGYSPPYASIVYDANNGRILQQLNADALRHPASVTKVMTLYMLFEQLERGRFKLDTELPVSANASRQAPSKLGLKPGEAIAVEDAINALVTKSANDVAVIVAEAIGGTEARFAELMTQKARSLGMNRSTFRNASGLPNPAQVTTARDLVTLGQAIQDRFPKYYTYFGTRSFSYDGATYRNHNRLLGAVEGVDGIKTGYTRASGFNLLTSAKSEGRHIITVVLGGNSARARDVAVASLVRQHLPVAYAGRRMTAKVIEVAKVNADDAPAATSPVRVAQKQVDSAFGTASASLPSHRPRPAVIAETPKPIQIEQGLVKNRPLNLAANSGGSTNSAPSALALVETSPRTPALRWVQSPPSQSQHVQNQANTASRLLPPGNVYYTNSTTPRTSLTSEIEQPLPVKPDLETTPLFGMPKNEQRLADNTAKTIIPSKSNINNIPPPVSVQAEEAKPEISKIETAKTALAKPSLAPASTRKGWIIQLAAAESESKARGIIESAIAKNSALLKQADSFTEAVTKGETTFYRARFAGFEAEEAQSACKALKRSGFSCFAQKI